MSGFPFLDRSTAPPYQQAFDYTGSPDGIQPVYVGWATPGTPANSASWMIRKFLYVSNGAGGFNIQNILYANGDVGFRTIWNTGSATVIGSTFLNAGVVFK